jgi:hypothetical protein
VKPGCAWFSGDVERVIEIKGERYLEMTLCSYFGEFFNHRSITAVLPVKTLKTFTLDEKKLSGKRIFVSLGEDNEIEVEVYANNKKTKLKKKEKDTGVKKIHRLQEFLSKRDKIVKEAKNNANEAKK